MLLGFFSRLGRLQAGQVATLRPGLFRRSKYLYLCILHCCSLSLFLTGLRMWQGTLVSWMP